MRKPSMFLFTSAASTGRFGRQYRRRMRRRYINMVIIFLFTFD